MIIKTITLKNFRNYASARIDLGKKINILSGKNAQGKTNILEAVYLCCVGKSFRGKDKELIKYGENVSKIQIEAEKLYGNYTVAIYLSSEQNKKILINGIAAAKTGELLGGINAVYFSPDELKLIKDAPGCRRKFLDIDISQTDRKYFFNLINYNKTLLQRNNILKSRSESLLPMLDIYNEQLALSGSYIAERRMNFLSSISADAAKIHSYISGGENIEISYSCGYKTEPDIYRGFLQSLNENREKDLRLGYTTAGPHRDDIKIVLNNADVRIYGSQGQQRTCALSLKLSELGYFRTVTGEYPILLLDDVFSELDENRKKRLTEYCSSTQTIITTTEKTGIGGVSFEVESGTIKRI